MPFRPPPLSELRCEHLGIEHGLSQSSVRCILQDHNGFLWFGTGDGLCRYDGYAFRTYHFNPRDSAGLAGDDISSLAEDHEGHLWVGTDRGLHRFRPETNGFYRPGQIPELTHPVCSGRILRLYIDRARRMWISTGEGTLVLKPGSSALSAFFPPVAHTWTLHPAWEDPDGTIWLVRQDSLFTTRGEHLRLDPVPVSSEIHTQIFSVFRDRSGTLWISTVGEGLVEFDPRSSALRRHIHSRAGTESVFDNFITMVREDNSGRLWVGTRSIGLTVFDRARSAFIRFVPPKSSDAPNQRFESVTPLFLDRSGILWAGYDGSGIVKINTNSPKFEHILLPASGPESTGENFLKPVLADHTGAIWLGTYDHGLARLDRREQSVRWYRRGGTTSPGIPANTILSLLEDRSGTVWVGTTGGLCRYDAEGDRFIPCETVPLSGDPNELMVLSLCQDSAGTVWAGTVDELRKVDASGRRLIPAPGPPELRTRIECIAADPRGVLWLGTLMQGLIRYDPAGPSAKGFLSGAEANSLSSNLVKCISVQPDGILWIGTGSGLDRFDQSGGIWQRFYEHDGLPNDFIYGILPDGRGNLWISTNHGISRMTVSDPAHPRFRNYTTEDGLQSYEFNTNCYFRSATGRMFFGGINGLNVFHPDSIADNPVAPIPAITGFKKFDQPVLSAGDPSALREIVLSYSESVFSLEFAGLEYTDPPRNRYAYMLDGFDRDWIFAGDRREARFTNLDPGSYVFRVRAANNDGVWSEQEASLTVTIIPPFWRRAWFIASALLFAAGGFGVAVRSISTRRLRGQLREMEHVQALQQERERISRDLHDNVGSQLVSIISGLDLAHKYSSGANERGRTLLESLREDARTSMSQLRETIWALKSSDLTIAQFAEHVESSVRRQISFCDTTTLSIHVSGRAPDLTLSPMQVLNCFRIIQEAVTNTIKHAGGASTIRIALESGGGLLRIGIADDGPGHQRSSADPFSGSGLANMKQRAEELGGALITDSRPGDGFTVTLTIPVTG